MRIGVFGGSFNPPHKGHVYIGHEVRARFGLDTVLFMAAGDPPHKSIAFGVDGETRLELTKAALKGESGLGASDMELKRGGKSYTVDTLRQLKAMYDDAQLFLIVGADMLHDLPRWREPEAIFAMADIIAAGRPNNPKIGEAAAKIRKDLGDRLHLSDISGPDISSTMVRERVHSALPIGELTPVGTMRLIYDKLLYQPGEILELALRLRRRLKPRRYDHSIGTMELAVELAEKYGVDGQKARVAALLHDCGKFNPEEQLSLSAELGLAADEYESAAPGLLHPKLGKALAVRDYGVTDEDILNAIACHTLGRVGMSALDKLVYVADKAEPNRAYPGVEELRQAAKRDLDEAVLMCMDNSAKEITNAGKKPHPASLVARAALMEDIKSKEVRH